MKTSILDTAIAGLLSAIALHFRQSELLRFGCQRVHNRHMRSLSAWTPQSIVPGESSATRTLPFGKVRIGDNPGAISFCLNLELNAKIAK
jgi:hypothetical protein